MNNKKEDIKEELNKLYIDVYNIAVQCLKNGFIPIPLNKVALDSVLKKVN